MLRVAFLQNRGVPTRRAGLTLVEVLVVVLLIGLMAALVSVNLGRGDREAVREEAARLAASLQQAQDEALLTGATLAWRGEATGYGYLRRGPARNWVPIDGDQGFAPRRLPAPVRLVDVKGGAAKSEAAALVVLTPFALPSPVRIVLEANAEKAAVDLGASTRVVVEGDL